MPRRRTAVFPVNGQGTLVYTVRKKSQFTIYITPDKQKVPKSLDFDSEFSEYEEEQSFDTENYISLTVGENFARFKLKMHKDGEERVLKEEYGKNIGIEPKELVSYWFSYDRDALTLKYGKGHVMTQTTLLEFPFLEGKSKGEEEHIRKKYNIFFNAEEKKYVVAESEKMVEDVTGGLVKIEQTLQFYPNPLVTNFSPIVKDSSKVTLFDLDRDQFMFSSSLPPACKELYDNIKGLQLEFPEDPITKLSDAIRYSINTPGMTLYEKLKEKEEQFAYLRVTLGPDRRTAPGIPYVLEIWPSGKGSPIHNHGGACAIIKVLFGRITCNIYNKITQPPEQTEMQPLTRFDLNEEQMTWIGPNWYQTHRLHNNTDDFCATIQCYRYDFNDAIHWPNFDYVGFVEDKEKYELEEFYPDSDFTFVNLRRTVLDEFQKFLEG
ncbi:uncharacterized protein [Clytia hemisphaerica]|uniref:Cysteine dioxygenase n=1 Tax=Clytia hemisphaerica TaxID=252671 RepID=A0A7M5WUN6_9CNID